MKPRSFKDLEIYRLANRLAVEIHRMSLKLPKFEMYEVGSQIRRASKSIKTNIVEGFGRRRYKQEFIRFLTFSQASCDETRDHLDTLYETRSLKNKSMYRRYSEEYELLGKKIGAFLRSVDKEHKV